MPWVKLDDAFPEHQKVDGLSDGAFRLHVAALCHAGRNLTDGFVGAERVARLVPRFRKQHVSELVTACLWHDAEGGWVIHDYLAYNPSAEKVKADRAAAAERMKQRRRSRERSHERTGERSGGSSATPTRPDPKGLGSGSSGTFRGEPAPSAADGDGASMAELMANSAEQARRLKLAVREGKSA